MSGVDIIVQQALDLKGCHAYDNYCQRFVRECYERAGIKASAASAAEAYSKWCVSNSMDNIPKGAAVYFKGTNAYGHVGIYTGNGNIVHAANGVRVQSLEYCAKKYLFLGWGWHGGTAPEGAKVKGTPKKAASPKKSNTTLSIEQLSSQSLQGTAFKRPESRLGSLGDTGVTYELLIENNYIYLPTLVGEIILEYRKNYYPAKLSFKVLKDNKLDFLEGSPVRLRIGGVDLFRGYVFEKHRTRRDLIEVTAYDSLRYFKNKDTLLYRNKKYCDLLRMLIADYGMAEGDICDTGYVIEKQLAEGTIFDILATAADITKEATGKEFVLLDDFGKICLRDSAAMVTGIEYNATKISGFNYTSTIDKQVYNHIVLAVDDSKQGLRSRYTLQDENTALWGRLGLYLTPKQQLTVPQLKAMGQTLLTKYSRKRRYLSLTNAKGYRSLRGGSIVQVNMDLGDIIVNEPMCCERVIHRFFKGHHLCDIDLYGREGEFDV